MNLSPVLIAGPTASGKSDVAVCLAELIGGEVVSVDSMQVYRRLDLGTAKPTPAMRERVPHHLVDVLDLTEGFDAARFVRMAGEAVAGIEARGKVPILCGGTGLYLNAWLNGLGDAPPPDPVLRAELEAVPTPVLLDELARRDWQTFDEIDVQNRRRVVRAVEVIRLTGNRSRCSGLRGLIGRLRWRAAVLDWSVPGRSWCGGSRIGLTGCSPPGWWTKPDDCCRKGWLGTGRRRRRLGIARSWNIWRVSAGCGRRLNG